MKEFILYGAGQNCKYLLDILPNAGYKAVAILDSNEKIVGSQLHGCKVYGRKDWIDFKHYMWCITVANWKEYGKIKEELINHYGFSDKNLMLYNALFCEAILQDKKMEDTIQKVIANKDEDVSANLLFGLMKGFVFGGIETRIRLLCDALMEKGKTVHVLSGNEVDNKEVSEIIRKSILIGGLYLGEKEKTIRSFVDIILKELPCTVISNQPDEILLAATIIKSICPDKIRVISVISGSLEYIYDAHLKLPQRSDLYIGVSEDIKSRLITEGITQVTSMTVPFPCDEELNRTYSCDDSELHIGYAGRLDGMEGYQKRMDLIIKVILQIHKRGIRFRMSIAGDGPAKDEMVNMLRKAGADKNVSFLGLLKKEEMQSFWKSQDIGINMADYEGRSISIAEMMGGGAIPVVTDTSGVREDISDGVNGYIVPIGDYEKAAEYICYLNEHRELLPIMGQKAHEEVWPKSRMDRHIDFWNNVLSTL